MLFDQLVLIGGLIVKRQDIKFLFGAALLGTLILAPVPGITDDNQIRIPMPPMPRIVLPSPPPMIWLPTPKVYVAHKSPYPIFFESGHYYLHQENSWYRGPGYGGPWTSIRHNRVPKKLRGFRQENWGQYQNEAEHNFRDRHDDRHDHAPFYARREAKEQHRPARWSEHDDQHGQDRHGRKDGHERDQQGRDEKHEKHEKRGKHDRDD